MKNVKNSKINEIYAKNQLNVEKVYSKNFKSYLNGYIIKVDKTWKIRRVENNRISYSKIESSNVNELIETLYFLNRILSFTHQDVCFLDKSLKLVQMKCVLEKDLRKMRRSLWQNFWRKYDLKSDIVQQVMDCIYKFEFADIKDKKDIQFGVDGEKRVAEYAETEVDKKKYGNITVAAWLKDYLD